jgi:hypothetical protein
MEARGFQDFAGFDPRIPGEATFRLVLGDIERISRYAPETKLGDLYCVAHIATEPTVAFEGLRTVDAKFGDPREYVSVPDPGGICLCGIPKPGIIKRTGREAAPDGATFCVFVDSRLTVLDWDWITADREYLDRPIGWKERFDRLLWSKNSM